MLSRSKWKVHEVVNISRSGYIYPTYVGMEVRISNGLNEQPLEIKSKMVGSRFGDFILTKKIGNSVHKLRKRSSGYRRRKKK